MEARSDKEGEAKDSSAERKPQSKLAPELQGLAEKVAQAGGKADLKIGTVRIQGGRVEIVVRMSGVDDKIVAKLTALGFKERGRNATANLIVGSIAVEKLEALAQLAGVEKVDVPGA
jgi:hypothetical protein